ncbi:hypothetical protein, partial [Salmonella enterica]|uniref:hypothetical protein n=1 Tax=Salmonella enterica TaxID=28901 RepID=UPI003F4C29BA
PAPGTPPPPSATPPPPRFIPAAAGNTSANTDPPGSLPVYPRWRWDNAQQPTPKNICGGLSPLARGKHRFREDP